MFVEDPLCAMKLDPDNSQGGSAQNAGVTYNFCSDSCREKFVGDPGRFVQPGPHAVGPPVPPGAKPDIARTVHYTCPMHPEIVRSVPGSGPIYKMDLEPRTVTAEEEGKPQTLGHDPSVLGRARSHRAGPRRSRCGRGGPSSFECGRPSSTAARAFS